MKSHKPKLEVLAVDNHILVVNKPAGLPVQQDESGDEDMLTIAKSYIKDKYDKPGNVFLGLVHRIDRPASGVVVFARTSKSAGRLGEQFRARQVRKKYVALVEGRCTGEGQLDHYLVTKGRTTVLAGKGSRGAKRARLNWRSKAIIGKWSLLEVELLTGRKHQIRCQLSSMGFPIAGDLRYNAKQSFDGQNIALHCCTLGFKHPVKRTDEFYSAMPRWNVDSSIHAHIREIIKQTRVAS
ncbi:MAG: RNA pseudouridine synthase [Rhodothermales bacterium]|nr:RNA pseudouridine synthase [Rhodothermales bacterium]